MLKSLFGKYRFLVVSIAFFLIFDLGVLVLNFYTSGKIAEQTELIDLAGRQRTLTQKMSKATLYIKSQKLQQWVYQSGLDELREHYDTFGSTLNAFSLGGQIESPTTGLPVTISAVNSGEGRAILDRANGLWVEFDAAISPLMVDTLVSDEEIKPASAFIAANNLKMFVIMDELTQFFKTTSDRQTTFLRAAQVVGISLATINFFIILFHFLGQLATRDKKIQIKQHESDQILGTINEGVFLLNQNMVMSGQHSKQLEDIFINKKMAGRNFEEFLSRYFPKKTVMTALDFVRLYFRSHIDPKLIEDVNPLKRIEATITNKDGEAEVKYLDFSFAQLGQGNNEPRILVTVRDVTAAILLEAQDQQAANELDQQVALLTQILPIPSADLELFVIENREGLDRINNLLKDTKHIRDNYHKTLTRIARETHKLKGSASLINFDLMVNNQHVLEDKLEQLRQIARVRNLNGRDLLTLTMQLKANYESIELIDDLRLRLGSYAHAKSNDLHASENQLPISGLQLNKKWFNLLGFVKRLADKERVSARLILRGFGKEVDAKLTDKLYPLTLQLIRNSIAHGIESEGSRLGLRKPNSGQITISLSHDKRGNYRFLFEDDGRGFDYERIRQELVERSVLSEAEAKALDSTGLVRCAFKDAVSTRLEADHLAGRGVGLSLVWYQIKALNGKLKIRSVQKEFTQFIIDFPFNNIGTGEIGLPLLDRAS